MLREIRRRARHLILPVLYICAVGYVGFHTLQGQRGVKVWSALNQEIEAARLEQKRLVDTRDRLEARAALLRAETLDREMLDEAARRMLNHGRPGEIVIYYQRQIGKTPLHR